MAECNQLVAARSRPKLICLEHLLGVNPICVHRQLVQVLDNLWEGCQLYVSIFSLKTVALFSAGKKLGLVLGTGF